MELSSSMEVSSSDVQLLTAYCLLLTAYFFDKDILQRCANAPGARDTDIVLLQRAFEGLDREIRSSPKSHVQALAKGLHVRDPVVFFHPDDGLVLRLRDDLQHLSRQAFAER